MKTQYFDEYIKHTFLNLGQAARDIRYFYYHPDADKNPLIGRSSHFLLSLFLRLKNLANNLFYALIPPHWHHSKEELMNMTSGTVKEWFLYGYAPWEYKDPSRR